MKTDQKLLGIMRALLPHKGNWYTPRTLYHYQNNLCVTDGTIGARLPCGPESPLAAHGVKCELNGRRAAEIGGERTFPDLLGLPNWSAEYSPELVTVYGELSARLPTIAQAAGADYISAKGYTQLSLGSWIKTRYACLLTRWGAKIFAPPGTGSYCERILYAKLPVGIEILLTCRASGASPDLEIGRGGERPAVAFMEKAGV